jgi:hypothetical protein
VKTKNPIIETRGSYTPSASSVPPPRPPKKKVTAPKQDILQDKLIHSACFCPPPWLKTPKRNRKVTRLQRIEIYNRGIATLETEIMLEQLECKHKNATKEHGSNTGNYDPMEDSYWTIFRCPDCLKVWRVDGSK